MCSFGSCQTRFEFLSQFRKVRNAFEYFVTQVQTHLPKTKRVWPMKILYLWRYCILKIWGIQVSFGCERSCSSHRRVSNSNSKVPQGGVYPHIKFERDRLNICRVNECSRRQGLRAAADAAADAAAATAMLKP